MHDESRPDLTPESPEPAGGIPRYALAGAVTLLGGLCLYGLSTLRGDIDPRRGELPGRAEEAAMLTPLPGDGPGDTRLPPTLDAVSSSQNRAAAEPASSAEDVELSDLSLQALEALEALEDRERRFELAGLAADDLDERSPADAERIEELDRHLEEESFDDAQLEMELIRAQGSLRMLRAFNEAAQDR